MDDSTLFPDNGKLPCVLIENKIDLLSEEEFKSSEEFIKDFASKNEFDHYFRTSAKTGENIEEAISYLIQKIIERFQNMKIEEYNLSSRPGASITLVADSSKRKSMGAKRDKETNCC